MNVAFGKLCAAGLVGLGLGLGQILPAAAQQPLLSTSGELSTSDERLRDDNSPFDVYQFEGMAGQVIQVSMESTEFDTYVFLLNAAGEVLDQNDDYDAAISTNSLIEIELPEDGEYQVVANSYDSSGRGRYTITVSELLSESGAAAPPAVAGLDESCQQAIERVKERLEMGRSLSVPYQTELAPYGDYPSDRPVIYSVAMQGADTQAVLNSPELLQSISSEFISSCESASALTIGQYRTGNQVMFGVVDGQAQFFDCAEDLGIIPGGRGLDRPVPWGYYYCTL